MRDDRNARAANEMLALETEEVVLLQKAKHCSPSVAAAL